MKLTLHPLTHQALPAPRPASSHTSPHRLLASGCSSANNVLCILLPLSRLPPQPPTTRTRAQDTPTAGRGLADAL